MAYQNMDISPSRRPFNNGQFRYRATLSSQQNPSSRNPEVQYFEGRYSSNQANSNSSKWEDEYEPGKSDEILAHAAEFTRHIQPPTNILSALSKPLAIPQIKAGTGQPFTRCWSSALIPFNITESDFIEFIDNLNIVSTANPPLQILDLAGGMLGMVPHHIFQLAGVGVQALAKLGTVVITKSRTDAYMEAVNRVYFTPRGLKAIIASQDAMALSLRLPGGIGKLAPMTDNDIDDSILERRLEGLAPYMSELRFDVPPPVQQSTLLAKMSARQVKRQTARSETKVLKQRQKQVKRIEKENGKIHKEESKEQRSYEKDMMKLDKDAMTAAEKGAEASIKGGSSAEKAERILARKIVKIEGKRGEVERGLTRDPVTEVYLESKLSKKDKKSEQPAEALWILVENL